MARFTDLPTEIHLLIFKEVFTCIDEDCSLWDWQESSKCYPRSRKSMLAMCLLSRLWRCLAQQKLYSYISIRADRLPAFIDLVKRNPALITYVNWFNITYAAGGWVDCEMEANSEEAGTTVRLSIGKRTEIFAKTWSNLTTLFQLAPNGSRLELPRLNICARDSYEGCRFNGEELPQFSMVPRSGSSLKLDSFPHFVTVKELVLKSEILEELELHPDIVRAVIHRNPDIETLELNMNDIRAYRGFRREIYSGLTGILTELTKTHQNLTSLVLYYPSSTGAFKESGWQGIYVLADLKNNFDPLCSALRVLSQRLVKFRYQGRISKQLFMSNKDESSCWPLLEEFVIEFEYVDSFGKALMSPRPDYSGYWYSGACDDCAYGDLDGDAGEDYALQSLMMAARKSPEWFEDGFDLLMCKPCRTNSMDTFRMRHDRKRLEELFIAGSQAVLQMPRIKIWKLHSVIKTVCFSFDGGKYLAMTAPWWRPSSKAWSIWQGRFPKLTLGVLHDSDYNFEEDYYI